MNNRFIPNLIISSVRNISTIACQIIEKCLSLSDLDMYKGFNTLIAVGRGSKRKLLNVIAFEWSIIRIARSNNLIDNQSNPLLMRRWGTTEIIQFISKGIMLKSFFAIKWWNFQGKNSIAQNNSFWLWLRQTFTSSIQWKALWNEKCSHRLGNFNGI